MVFFLKNLETENLLVLSNNYNYKIGRKSTNDIIIKSTTVSKFHAELSIKCGKATLKDLASKRGIFVNGEKKLKTELKHLDKIKFGLCEKIYQFIDEKWSTYVPSNYPPEYLVSVKHTLNKCDVAYLTQYTKENCTHVTTEKFVLNQEHILPLVHRKSIVRFKFWFQYQKALENIELCPDIKDYMPTLSRELKERNVEISTNLNRNFLFEDKYFVFFDPDGITEAGELVEACAGKVLDWSKLKIETKSKITVTCDPNYLVVYSEIPEYLPQIKTVQRCIKMEGLRPIKLKEIFWAVLFGSIHKYCNPCYKANKKSLSQSQSSQISHSEGDTVSSTQSKIKSVEPNEELMKKIAQSSINLTKLPKDSQNKKIKQSKELHKKLAASPTALSEAPDTIGQNTNILQSDSDNLLSTQRTQPLTEETYKEASQSKTTLMKTDKTVLIEQRSPDSTTPEFIGETQFFLKTECLSDKHITSTQKDARELQEMLDQIDKDSDLKLERENKLSQKTKLVNAEEDSCLKLERENRLVNDEHVDKHNEKKNKKHPKLVINPFAKTRQGLIKNISPSNKESENIVKEIIDLTDSPQNSENIVFYSANSTKPLFNSAKDVNNHPLDSQSLEKDLSGSIESKTKNKAAEKRRDSANAFTRKTSASGLQNLEQDPFLNDTQRAPETIPAVNKTAKIAESPVRGECIHCDGTCSGVEGFCLHNLIDSNNPTSFKNNFFLESQKQYFTGSETGSESLNATKSLNNDDDDVDMIEENSPSQKITYKTKKQTKQLPGWLTSSKVKQKCHIQETINEDSETESKILRLSKDPRIRVRSMKKINLMTEISPPKKKLIDVGNYSNELCYPSTSKDLINITTCDLFESNNCRDKSPDARCENRLDNANEFMESLPSTSKDPMPNASKNDADGDLLNLNKCTDKPPDARCKNRLDNPNEFMESLPSTSKDHMPNASKNDADGDLLNLNKCTDKPPDARSKNRLDNPNEFMESLPSTSKDHMPNASKNDADDDLLNLNKCTDKPPDTRSKNKLDNANEVMESLPSISKDPMPNVSKNEIDGDLLNSNKCTDKPPDTKYKNKLDNANEYMESFPSTSKDPMSKASKKLSDSNTCRDKLPDTRYENKLDNANKSMENVSKQNNCSLENTEKNNDKINIPNKENEECQASASNLPEHDEIHHDFRDELLDLLTVDVYSSPIEPNCDDMEGLEATEDDNYKSKCSTSIKSSDLYLKGSVFSSFGTPAVGNDGSNNDTTLCSVAENISKNQKSVRPSSTITRKRSPQKTQIVTRKMSSPIKPQPESSKLSEHSSEGPPSPQRKTKSRRLRQIRLTGSYLTKRKLSSSSSSSRGPSPVKRTLLGTPEKLSPTRKSERNADTPSKRTKVINLFNESIVIEEPQKKIRPVNSQNKETQKKAQVLNTLKKESENKTKSVNTRKKGAVEKKTQSLTVTRSNQNKNEKYPSKIKSEVVNKSSSEDSEVCSSPIRRTKVKKVVKKKTC